MQKIIDLKKQTNLLIDELKSVCADAGLGNDGNEYKIITEIFLYKFINDKFIYELKKIDKKLSKETNPEKYLANLSKENYDILMIRLNENVARLKPNQFISNIFNKQDERDFSKIFDDNLISIAKDNDNIFSQLTSGGKKIPIFESISQYIRDNPNEFCKAIVNKLINFSFEKFFEKDQKFDFYATIFEYLIKDYNSNSGGTDYAEYFTPHSVAKIMATCLNTKKAKNVTCYDPASGSGTLLMNIANSIGDENCTIFSQDISQKSSKFLRLNLILNNLVHSIPNAIQGNTIKDPYHKDNNKNLKTFDFIVSNPPFKTDFSEYRNDLDSNENKDRFFAGIPKITPKDPNKMEIYLLFIQHIIFSLSENGKAAIVVPTGFLTSKSGIGRKIREYLVEKKILRGAISMPDNIFANTGTKVSILFLDKESKFENVLFIDATKEGTKIKDENKKQKTLLSTEDEKKIIDTFVNNNVVDDFSVYVNLDSIKDKKYSFSAGHYFEVKHNFESISLKEFKEINDLFKKDLTQLSEENDKIEKEIYENLKKIKYEN